ncbi:MAG: anti-sigma factor family protein [Acidobacteriota bacterium]
MECQTCSERLTALIDGELSLPERTAVREHLAECPDCHEDYESLLYSYRLVDSLDEIELDPRLWDRIGLEISSLRGGFYIRGRRLFRLTLLPAAATVVIAVALSAGLYWSSAVDAAEWESRLNGFVRDRDRLEIQHETLLHAQQVGWEAANPFAPDTEEESERNPFATE